MHRDNGMLLCTSQQDLTNGQGSVLKQSLRELGNGARTLNVNIYHLYHHVYSFPGLMCSRIMFLAYDHLADGFQP